MIVGGKELRLTDIDVFGCLYEFLQTFFSSRIEYEGYDLVLCQESG